MAQQFSYLSSLKPVKFISFMNTVPRNCTFKKAVTVTSSSEPEADEKDPVKIALAKAKAYKKSIQSNASPKIIQNPVSESSENGAENGELASGIINGGNEGVPSSVRLAMERAQEYRRKKLVGVSSVERDETKPRLEEKKREISTGKPGEKSALSKKEGPTVSSIDFVGLGFSDKKQNRGLPPGLVPVTDPFPEGDLPEVEIIVGDASKFGNAGTSIPRTDLEDANKELYKPTVSTWGVFPRPRNISKTYGGGKNICPGELLETAEEKAAKQARTRLLISAYKRQLGLSIDPKLRSECEKALTDGDSLMDLGKLKEALPFYEQVMGNLAFQSELHGLAVLQWSICQDSLGRSDEARIMYEKLQAHPNAQVRKKARQLMFGFQAMEMMKVRSSAVSPTKTGYQNMFEVFVENEANYLLEDAEVDEDAASQAFLYFVFLVSPLFLVLAMAIQKGA